ncbi:SH3 domain-containing protein [Lentisalinibacter salinarum]|uniref:SH3 domain-containing protein n=1 Tax=Lentisalinibacter salinarum TaxID=2992239 RepID=UPI00386F86A7
MRSLAVVFALFLCCVLATDAQAEERYRQVTVAEPYLEMHTGPGRGYPVFNVVERGDAVELLKRRTEWFKVRDTRGREGWVHEREMLMTLDEAGAPTEFETAGREEYLVRRWESGGLTGDFGGANVISGYLGYSFTPNLALELWGTQLLGNFSDGWMANVSIVHQTWPHWRVSPFFTLGTGVLRIEPVATLVQPSDRTDQTAHVGVGVRAWVTRRFIFRAEYKSYVVFTSRDENEEIEEWKVGFGFFF